MCKSTIKKYFIYQSTISVLFALFIGAGNELQASEINKTNETEERIFARIDDITISYGEFIEIFKAAVRHKYYHGRVPEDELEKFRKQVAEDIVVQILVHREAEKQGIKPNTDKILKGIEEYDKKYSPSPDWSKQKEKIIPHLIKRLERQDLIEQMEAKVKNVKQPDASLVKQYYEKNKDKFTEPKRLWISVILLIVPPSADKKMWDDAVVAANQFKKRIEDGEEFAFIARQYSGHPSALNGGDLGYLHQGMLDEDAQAAVSKLKIDEISEPVRVLEGVTIFRLNGIQPEKIRPFVDVEKRAAGLAYREMQEKAWKNYTKELISSANVKVNKDFYAQNDEK